MGVKLEWDIESEKGKHKDLREDPAERKHRYRGIFRLLLVIGVLLLIGSGFAYVIWQRWNMVNDQLESLLRETVQAEVAALRIGDISSFLDLQRSASDDWYALQNSTFNAYQNLKASRDVTLTGQVVNVVLDKERGRVQVEEIIDGVPYLQTWFYWRDEDGWRHVPPDYTFWGEESSIETSRFRIRYHTVDQVTAQSIAQTFERWLNELCGIFDCSTLPFITVDLLPDNLPKASWASPDINTWQLLIPSPYLGRARSDLPFDNEFQLASATLLAERFVNQTMDYRPISAGYDAEFLHASTIRWLVGRMLQVNPETYLIDSLVQAYGPSTLLNVLRSLQGNGDISVLSSVIGVVLSDLPLDWRDFIAWRLSTEDALIASGDETNWRRFYDLSDSGVSTIAYGRFTANQPALTYRVLEVVRAVSAEGVPFLQVRVQMESSTGSSEQVVLFKWVNNNWLRAS